MASRLKTRALLAALHALTWLAGVLPRYPVADWLCRAGGVVWYLVAPAARDAVRANLCHILHRAPSRWEMVQVFQNGALNYWDTFAIPHVSRAELLALVDLQGAEHIDAALRLGKGAILASAHLGSIGLVGQIMPVLGHPTTGLLEPIKPPELFDFFARQRQGTDFHLYPAGASGLRGLVQALRRNEVVGLITDREFGGASVEVTFFDHPTLFAEGTAALSLRTGAPILIGVCARKSGGRFDAWIEPLPPVLMGGDQKANVRAQTQAVARRLQYYVASHPAQWTVFQRRWPG